MPVAPVSSTAFLDLVRRSGVADPERLALECPNASRLPAEPHKAAAYLVKKGLITKFQAGQLLQGRHKGFRVGPYVIRELIGRGGMGAVYQAEHGELRRRVAIKVLAAGADSNSQLVQKRFIREARSAAALDHPNIVRMFDVGRHNETPYLVMEYVEGETLQQLIDRNGAFPPLVAADYTAQAAAGLQHAYEQGFVHRDIKPANLILDRTGTIKILDMGLARSATDPSDQLTERLDHGAVVGTADFIAPEQAMCEPDVDIRADIYSLGATFYALVTGKPPFDGNTTQKLVQHQIKPAPALSSLVSKLPPGIAVVVARMLAKKPSHRYRTPAEVIAALSEWVGKNPRVVAGLSRTNLGRSSDINSVLDELKAKIADPSSTLSDSVAVLDILTEQGGKETGPINRQITVRSRRVRPDELVSEEVAPRWRKATVVALASGLLIGIGVALALVFR